MKPTHGDARVPRRPGPLSRLLGRANASPRAALDWLAGRMPGLDETDRAELAALGRWAGPAGGGGAAERTLLVASFLPLPYGIKIEALFAAAMRAQGYRVVVVCNDRTEALVRAYHERVFGFEVTVLEDFMAVTDSAPVRRAMEGLDSAADEAAIKAFRYLGAPVGLHALATHLASAPQGLQPDGMGRLRRILRYSMLLVEACGRLLQQVRPNLVLAVEKGFVGTAELFHVAVGRGIDYVQWVGCHEPESVMLKRYHDGNRREHPFSICASAWRRIVDGGFDARLRDGVMEEFARGYDNGAWFRYKNLAAESSRGEPAELKRRLGLDPARKTAVIYAHILNDANLFYGEDLFARGFEEWLVETVRAAGRNPRVNWILKMHPANLYRNAKLGYEGEFGEVLALRRAFGEVPEFLTLVRPDEKISPMTFFQITDIGLTVRGTVGLELPCFGVPVLTAGSGRYAGRGFTVDSASVGEYLERLARIHELPRLSREQEELALLYAHYVFRRRPAKYDAVAEDRYDHPVRHPRHRDVRFRADSLRVAIDDAQVRRICGFLQSRDEDFFFPPV